MDNTLNENEILNQDIEPNNNLDDSQPKQGKIAKFKQFLFNRNAEKKYNKELKNDANKSKNTTLPENCEKTKKYQRKLNDYLDAIENQLDKVDEQNKMLLFYLTTVKENNETLLSQVNHLTKHNEELNTQFKLSKRREKIAKTLAIISSIAAIAFTAWRIIDAFISAGGG
ncbi:MAG: hypothetical protein FWE03_00685 [Firmicutes bacterium]|nr:hypothetical protein [Bacillota bacterium]